MADSNELTRVPTTSGHRRSSFGPATETLPAAWYRDVEYFESERHTVWSDEWLMVCPMADVASSGGYVVLDEDQCIVESVERNLDAGVYRVGRLYPKHETRSHGSNSGW